MSTELQVQRENLLALIGDAQIPENMLSTEFFSEAQVELATKQSAVGAIMVQFFNWFAQQAGAAVTKEQVLEWVDTAVDALFAKLNRPALNLIKPFVKAQVKQIVSNLYDSFVSGNAGPVTA